MHRNETKSVLTLETMPKHFLNYSKSTLKKSKKRLFWPQNGQKWPLKSAKMSNFLTENFDFWGYLNTFWAENTPKSRPFKVENNAQTLPKQLQNNFEKVQKTTFSTPKMVKNDPSKRSKWAKFWQKILILGVIYQPLELKIPPKVGLLRSKTMPKQFLNNSKATLKKFRKRLFRPPKWQNHGSQLDQKCRFLGPFSLYELYFCLVGTKNFAKIVPPPLWVNTFKKSNLVKIQF